MFVISKCYDDNNKKELGNKLWITYGPNGSSRGKAEDYESIDEIEARFIDPMNQLINDVTGHPITGAGAHAK